MYEFDSPSTPEKKCKLQDGSIVPYDLVCSHTHFEGERGTYPNLNLKYLGQGYIYSVNGVLQYDEEPKIQTDHFWEKVY